MRTTVQMNKEMIDKIDMDKIRRGIDTSKKIVKYSLLPGQYARLRLIELTLDEWKIINKWIIDNTTEYESFNMRDAIMTIMNDYR